MSPGGIFDKVRSCRYTRKEEQKAERNCQDVAGEDIQKDFQIKTELKLKVKKKQMKLENC